MYYVREMNEVPVVWRRPMRSGPTTPLIVLLHGRGADEHDLADLAPTLAPAAAFASLRAPVALDGGGYTWFRDRGVGRPIAASMRESIDYVRGWLEGPTASAYARDRTYLLGFSAGMMMAGALLLDDPKRFAGAVLLSGAIALDADENATPGRLAGVSIFTAHGTLDDVIPTHLVEQTMRYLTDRSGATLDQRTYPRGHAIAQTERNDIAQWFAERI
jgi:phospholipase/carboxylesterase